MTAPLAEARALFDRWERYGIRYCHFKSNEHLLAGLAGLTDLDILVDPRDAPAARATLAEGGFKVFTGLGSASYPCVEDYLGYGAATGRLLHIQLHYALIVGEMHLKGYQLGFDLDVLAHRVADPATGVFTSEPHYELLLLLIRYALKLRLRDFVQESLGRAFFSGQAVVELEWLSKRVDRDRLEELANDLLGVEAGGRVPQLLDTPPSAAELWRFRRRAARVLDDWRTYGPVQSRLLRLVREAWWLCAGINKRFVKLPFPFHRTNPAGGRIVALLGPDGSGKSTILENVHGWLSRKIDVYPVYFGSGVGSASMVRWPMRVALHTWRRIAPRKQADGPRSSTGEQKTTPARIVWALALALEKRSKMRRARRARNRGMLVLCDRYPQTQILGFNDGPLLAGLAKHRSALLRRLGAWERSAYERAVGRGPDLVIKLRVSPNVAVERKPEMSAEEIRRRLVAVAAIEYGPRCVEVTVDADRPLDDVLLEVKHAIWERL